MPWVRMVHSNYRSGRQKIVEGMEKFFGGMEMQSFLHHSDVMG